MRKTHVVSAVIIAGIALLILGLRRDSRGLDPAPETTSELHEPLVEIPSPKTRATSQQEDVAPRPFTPAEQAPLGRPRRVVVANASASDIERLRSQFPPGTIFVRAEDLAPPKRKPDHEADESATHEPAEHTATRERWLKEKSDTAWTQQMSDTIRRTVEGELAGEARYSQLDCRKTVCRGIIKFADEMDAKAFVKAHEKDGQLSVALESHDPTFDGTGFDRSEYSYEMLITRAENGARSAGQSPSSTEEETAPKADETGEVNTGDGTEVTVGLLAE